MLIMPSLVSHIIGYNDPQGLAHRTISNATFFYEVSNLPLVALNEEIFKALILLTLLKLLPFHRSVKYPVAVLLTAAVFGYNHTFLWPKQVFIPLMFTAIPGLIILCLWRSIYPMVIAHYVFDFLAYVNIWPYTSGYRIQPLLIALLFSMISILAYVFIVKGLFRLGNFLKIKWQSQVSG